MNSSLLKYKDTRSNFCKKDLKKNKIAYGYTSTVYKIKNVVIKEIYIPINDVTKTTRYYELLTNIFMKENLPDYSIPFYGFEVCDKKLYMKFKYVGKSLGETILDYSVSELKKIYKNVNKALDVLNTKVIHNDLNTFNIYVDKDLNVIFGDYGKASFDISKNNDKQFFKQEFIKRLISAYYFKQYNLEEIKTHMNKDHYNYNDFLKYIEHEKQYAKRKFSFRPEKFIDEMFTYYYYIILVRFLFDKYNDYFFLEHIKLTPEMKSFILHLRL